MHRMEVLAALPVAPMEGASKAERVEPDSRHWWTACRIRGACGLGSRWCRRRRARALRAARAQQPQGLCQQSAWPN